MAKALSSWLLSTAILLTMTPFTQAAFTDVTVNHFNYDAISYVEGQKIVNGYPDGSFKPDNTVNRAEFTKIIVGALVNADDLERGLRCFGDVDSSQWYAPYVCEAKIRGWIGGYPDKTFRPTQPISFVEAAKILSGAFELQTRPDTVWYKPYVEALEVKKAIPVTIKSFDKNITRGELAEMVYRIQSNVTDKESTTYAYIADPTNQKPNTPPTLPTTRDIRITARNYQFSPNEIEVNRGDTLKIELSSADFRYDFSLDGYGLSKTVNGEETINFEIEVTESGVFNFSCKLNCVGHPEAKGTLTVR